MREFLTAEAVDDELGEGQRIYDTQENIYEIRSHSDGIVGGPTAESRLYRESGTWHAKIRLPEDDKWDAWRTVKELNQRIEDEYGFDPTISASYFDQHGSQPLNNTEAGEDGINGDLTYNDPEEVNLFEAEDWEPKHVLTYMGGSTATGAVAGGAAAAFFPPAIPVGAMMGGFAGLIGGYMDVFAGAMGFETTISNQMSKRLSAYRQDRKGEHLTDNSFLSNLNTKRQLEPEAEETADEELYQEYKELAEQNLEATLDQVMDLSLHSFEETGGLHAVAEFDDYGEARDFIATIQDVNIQDRDEPSIYQAREQFADIFQYMNEDEQRELIERVREHGSGSVETYLETHHHDLMEDVCGRS